jgi:anti-sigma factor RsiW
VSHLGQRLSALIDGELDAAERDRVLVHLARCDPCRGEAVALRTLKRRMSALGETAADGALTRRLMGLAGPGEDYLRPQKFPTASLPQRPAAGQGSARWPDLRPGWYLGAGAVAVFLAGLGTAAFMAGGSQDLPAPKVTPAVYTYYTQHELMIGATPAGPATTRRPVGKNAAPHSP